jgi:hypothetical protein
VGYFEGLTNGSFKTDSEGNTVFYPWGVFGKGRILPDEPTEKKVRGFVSLYYKVSLPSIIGAGVIIGWAWAFVLVPILAGWFYFGSKSLVKEFPYSEEKLTLKEGYKNSAKGHNTSTLWLLLVCSLLFVFMGIFVLTIAKSSADVMLGWMLVILFGASAAAIGYMLKMKKA